MSALVLPDSAPATPCRLTLSFPVSISTCCTCHTLSHDARTWRPQSHVRAEVPRALSGGSVGTGNSETQPAEIVSHGASLVLHLSDLLCALISFALYAKQQTIIIISSADAHVCVCELYSLLRAYESGARRCSLPTRPLMVVASPAQLWPARAVVIPA